MHVVFPSPFLYFSASLATRVWSSFFFFKDSSSSYSLLTRFLSSFHFILNSKSFLLPKRNARPLPPPPSWNWKSPPCPPSFYITSVSEFFLCVCRGEKKTGLVAMTFLFVIQKEQKKKQIRKGKYRGGRACLFVSLGQSFFFFFFFFLNIFLIWNKIQILLIFVHRL